MEWDGQPWGTSLVTTSSTSTPATGSAALQGGCTRLSIAQLLREARNRWLKGQEVLYILRNFHLQGYRHNVDVVRCPPSGSVFLFRPKVTKYRMDGINWRRRDGKRLQEGHEKLKVDGVEVLRCCYVQSEDNRALHRRVYSLLDGSDQTVLVHYLEDKSPATVTTSSASTSTGRSQPPSTPPVWSLHSHHCQFAYPPSAATTVPCHSPLPSSFPVLQLPHYRPIAPMPSLSPTLSATQLNVPRPVCGTVQQRVPDRETASEDWELEEELFNIVADCTSPSQLAAPLPGSPYSGLRSENSWPTVIHDLSPGWDYSVGGAKVLITGSFPSTPAEGLRFCCMFDNIVVPADIVQVGVLRCFAPSHAAGIVPLCLTFGDCTPISNIMYFEYKEVPAMEMKDTTSLSHAPSPLLYDDAFKSDVLQRLAAIENTMRSTSSSNAEEDGEKGRQVNDGDYLKLLEAFSILVKLESGRDLEDATRREREEEAALLIQTTFRNYRSKKRDEAAKKIQKAYRQRHALRSGAATTIQAAFRRYKQKKRFVKLKGQQPPHDNAKKN